MMRYKGTLLLLVTIAFFTVLQGQEAPYIVVTDTEGVKHDLYRDYIREGRSVMLSIFFSSCAPCQLIAEDLQDLYSEWGNGDYDVEFLQVSSEDWETNETAEAYRTALGLTFPVASAEGGSLAAVDSLVNGGFGSFFGAPLYTVIGPDSTLEWDIIGFGNEETIYELDQALLRTGAEKPVTSTYHLSTPPVVSVYPNPATDQIWIDVATREVGTWQIFDMEGRIILTGRLDPSGVTISRPGDISAGQYLMIINTGKQVFNQSIIKI